MPNGLALARAVGDWGWLIGACLGGLLYLAAMRSLGEGKLDKPALMSRDLKLNG